MSSLPEYTTNHPFFKKIKVEMQPEQLKYKEKMDDFSNLDKDEQREVIFGLTDLGFYWPNPLRQEGFWCDNEEKDFLFKEYPYPKENEIPKEEVADFLSKLTKVEKKLHKYTYMGFSKCRICGQVNGTQTYHTDLFAWPEGYKHYIKEHGILPSAAFVLHIRELI